MIHSCNLNQDTRVCNIIQVCRPAAVNRGCCSCSCSVHRCACATRAGSVCAGRCREETGRETLGLGPELLHTPQPLLYHPVPWNYPPVPLYLPPLHLSNFCVCSTQGTSPALWCLRLWRVSSPHACQDHLLSLSVLGHQR